MTTPPSRNDPDSTVEPGRRVDRRMFAAAAGTGLATVGLVRIGLAQTSDTAGSATPDAASGTPDLDQPQLALDDERLTELLEKFDADLATVQADRDAVAAEVDTTTIDAVLADAQAQRDAAQAALDGDAADLATRAAVAAHSELHAARALILAQVSYAGLPSQESRASRTLSGAHELVTAAGDAATDAGTDIAFQVTTSQDLYTAAYDQFGSGAFAHASLNGQAAALVAQAGLALAGEETDAGFGGHSIGDSMFGGDRITRRDDKPDSDDSVTGAATPSASDDAETSPPAPDFGS